MIFLRRMLCAFACAALVIPNFALHASAEETSPIRIGEIAWAGSSKSTADEWIELWNRSNTPVSIGNWSLVGGGENNRRIVFAAEAVIPAYGTYLIANYAMGDAKTTLNISPNVVTTTISLSNSAMQIELRNASDVAVDLVGDGGTPAAGTSLPAKMTMIRIDPLLVGTDEAAWSSATTSVGMIDGVSDLGTPGICDVCTTTIPEPSEEPIPEPTPVEPQPEPTPSEEPTEIPAGTSTEPIPTPEETPVEVPPTSEPIPEPVYEPIPEPEIPPVIEVPTEQPAPTEEPAAPVEEPALPKPAYGMLRLSEIAPNPESGKEWVEIVSLDAVNIIPLVGCEVHDASGKIYTFGEVTIDPTTSTYVRIELASSKLNNGGDTVVLYSPDGTLLDAVTYDSTPKGEGWIRFPSPDGAWKAGTTLTPNAPNQWEAEPVPQTPAPTPAPTPTSTPSTPSTVTSTPGTRPPTALELDAARRSYETWDGKTTIVKKPIVKPPPKASTPKSSTTTSKTTKKTTTSVKKTSSKAITPLTFDMRTSDAFGNTKVKLTGTVGTPPGLLTNRAFVLFSTDGRGLEVRVPSSKKLPDAGMTLDVVGTLAFSAEGIPYLRMAAGDTWTTRAPALQTTPRLADLIAPGAEDAWSLVQVTGTVMSVSGSTVSLDLGDATIDVYFRPVAGYRAKRLVAGDTIVVRGVLDAAHDPVRILPRSADDVVILTHAETKKDGAALTTSNNLQLPPWMPFGAAAGAVVVAEGAKRVHQARKRRALERVLVDVSPVGDSK